MIRSVAIFALLVVLTSSELRSGFNDSRCEVDTVCKTVTFNCDTKVPVQAPIGTQEVAETQNTCIIKAQAKRIGEFTYFFVVTQSGLKRINKAVVVFDNITAPCEKIERSPFNVDFDCTAQITVENVILTRLDPSFKKFTIDFHNTSGSVFSMEVDKPNRDKLWNTNTCYSTAFWNMALNSTDNSSVKYDIMHIDTTAQVLKCEKGYRLNLIRDGSDFELRIRANEIACVNTSEGYLWQADYEPGKNEALAVFIKNAPGEVVKDETTYVKYINERVAIGCVKLAEHCCPEPRLKHCVGCIAVTKIREIDQQCFRYAECPEGSKLLVSPDPPDDDALDALGCRERSLVNEDEEGYNWIMRTKKDKIVRGRWSANYQNIEEWACQWNKTMRDKMTSDETDENVFPMEHKGPLLKRKVTDQEKPTPKEEPNWFAENWVSHILVPIIIVAAVIGGIVFIACVIQTKDQQENLLREQRRREAERAEDGRSFRDPLLRSSIQSTHSDPQTTTRSIVS